MPAGNQKYLSEIIIKYDKFIIIISYYTVR